MTPINPNWMSLKEEAFAAYIPDEVLKYRSDEIENVRVWSKENTISTPIEIEIGSNRGRFILGLARGRRDCFFLGIELKASLVRLSNNKLKREGLDNGTVINADARIAIPMLCKPKSVSAVYVLFPDPWWKKRHERRRLLDETFFELLHEFLTDDGVFVLMTDVRAYYENVRDYLAQSELFDIIDNADIPHRNTWELTTRERHCIADNTPYDTLAVRVKRKDLAQ